MSEPTVWLIQESWSQNSDLSSAQRYGKVVPILAASDRPSQSPGPAFFKLHQRLREEFKPDDYLVYGLSDPMSLLLTGVVLEQQGLTRQPINWLRWERERDTNGKRQQGTGFYVPTITELRRP